MTGFQAPYNRARSGLRVGVKVAAVHGDKVKSPLHHAAPYSPAMCRIDSLLL